jgi:arginine-tRNA-protein transferase
VTEQLTTRLPQFFLTAPTPCPYLEGQRECKIFTYLSGTHADALNNALTHIGFRRSQNIIYRPACQGCQACISVRIPVQRFLGSVNMRRVMRRNADLDISVVRTHASEEQFTLLRNYLDARHSDGGMIGMTPIDYISMVEETQVTTHLVEYRLRHRLASTSEGMKGPLLGVALTDILDDGYSMVYSFYDPHEVRRSLGTFIVLDHIERARRNNIDYVYLGYWIKGSPKMDYKRRFRPLEALGPQGWEEISPSE